MSDGEWHDVDVLAREGRELTAEPRGAPTFGREAELDALVRALAGRKSVVLLGPPGVGKSALVRKLVERVRSGSAPGLVGATVHELATTGLVAGTRYTGMQEDKIASLLRHARPDRIVYVPDLWNVTQAGSYSTNPRGVYDLMRPGIEADRLVLVGEMTAGRWASLCREHPFLERDFATIAVDPTDDEETRDVMLRAARELSPEVTFERAAVDRAFALSRKFLPTQSFPGKGIDLVRRVALAHRGDPRPVTEAFVEELFARHTGLPLHVVSPRVEVTYDDMCGFLSERVLGQDDAVRAVADVLALYKTGLSNPDRPVGVLLVVGPTGVGKTELAKATAEFLFGSATRIHRIDLSEYKDFHSFEKLIGDARKGTPGQLTEFVRKNPFCVILLDEFEKGHPNLADLFLQVFDDGRLTDALGETVSFQHALILLTSNLGSDRAELEGAIGFAGEDRASPQRLRREAKRALEAHYRPEFLNRIDRVLFMRPLERAELMRIARREVGRLYRREGLVERDLLLEVDEGVIELLVERGTDPKYGARPLKRAIEELLVVPLARALLAASFCRFELFRVSRAGEGVEISIEPTEASRRLEGLARRSRVSDGEGGVRSLSLADVKREVGALFQRMASLEAAADVSGMRAELLALEAKEASPAFWEEAFGHDGALVRRHRIGMEVRRLDELRGEVTAVRELCEASFREADDSVAEELTDAFARLDRRLARAERELLVFDGADQGDATVTVRPAGAGEGVARWVEEVAEMYASWARDHGFRVERRRGAEEVELFVGGAFAFGYLRGEAGVHRLIMPPPKGGDRRGETALARVLVAGAQGAAAAAPSDDAPVRTYDLWRSRGVRDKRSGHAEGDVRRVLAGRIDGFLDAGIDARARPPDSAPRSA